MSLSMHRVTTQTLLQGLAVLSSLLEKGEAHAKAAGIDPSELTEARLIADMLPLTGQVQRASDTAKGAIARLTGIDTPSFPDEEKTFADLQARIAKTVAFLEGVDPAVFEGAEDRAVAIRFPSLSLDFTGADYLLKFVLPNFYFHVTTTHDILRHKGVVIGKLDYLSL